ncbi:MAG: hypothetical protein ACXW0Q_12610 [Methylovulum sp.]
MKKVITSAFADLVRVYEQSSADEILAIFIQRFGLSWATVLPHPIIKLLVVVATPHSIQF